MEINEMAFAKINISLDVVSKMENGWHEMCMVMQSVSLHDDVKIQARKGKGNITVSTNRSYLPTDRRNIAYRAADIFMESTGIKDFDISIKVRKKIPVCAGLGGGSTDGAAVLRGLNRMFSAGLDRIQLEELGKKLGSDVPFCISGGTVLATGTGTDLTDIKPIPNCSIVICKPSFSVSTPELFSQIDCGKIKCRPDTKGLMNAIENEDLKEIGKRMYNVFEDVLITGRDKVEHIKSVMYDCQAVGACMTGTGSAVFGLFENEINGERALEALKAEYRETFLCKVKERIKI